MPSTGVDRISGNTTSVAVKAPVKVCVNNPASPTVLSGIQTIQGVTLSAGGATSTGNAPPDRVLVNDQNLTVGGAATNGIYLVQTGAWIPAYDCNGPRDLILGTLVPVEGGTYAGTLWQCTTTDNPIDIGLSPLTFAQNPFLPVEASSTTSNTIGTGAKTFATQSGLPFGTGQFILVASSANAANYMHGQVTSYSGTSLVVNVLDIGGTGTLASWNIFPSSPQVTTPGAGTITNAMLANAAANTVKANATNGNASPTDVALTASTLLGRGPSGNIAAIPYSTFTATLPTISSFQNLKIVWASNTTATITAGQVILQTAAAGAAFLAAPVSVTLTTSTSGAGGLDTGALANATWYFVYLIYNGTTVNALMSLSATAPTLPSGYTYFTSAIGVVRTAAAATTLVGFIQYGRDWQYVVGNNLSAIPVMTSGSNSAVYTATAVAAFVPTAVAAKIKLILNASNVATTTAFAAPNANYGGSSSLTNPAPLQAISITSGTAQNITGEFLLESTNVYYSSNAAEAALSCMGFTINI